MQSMIFKLYIVFYTMCSSGLSEASTHEQMNNNNNFSILPFIVMHPDKGPVPLDLNDRNTQNSIQTFYKLPLIFFPRLPFDFHYTKNSKGTLIIQNIGLVSSQFEIRIFGPDSDGRFAWIAKTSHSLECFSLTIKFAGKRYYPIEYPKGCNFQKSHLIDLIFTPYPEETFNSNNCSINYTPEEKYLNECVRKALTQFMGFYAYRQIYIYDDDHTIIAPKERGKFQKKGKNGLIKMLSFLFRLVLFL